MAPTNTSAHLNLTASRAAEVQALRAELAGKIENAKAAAIEAAADERAAIAKKMAVQLAFNKARAEVAAKQQEILAAEELGNAQSLETLNKEKDTLATKMHAAQEQLDEASKAANTATTKAQTASQVVNTLTTQRDTIAKGANAKATTLLTLVTGGLTKAFNTLKAAMASNPLGIIAVAITTVIGAMMTLKTTSEETSEEVTRFGESATKQARNVETLLAVINSTSARSKVHRDAVNELIRVYDDYGIKIDAERDKIEQLNGMRERLIALIRQEGEERQRANLLASYEDAINAATKDMKDTLQTAYANAEWQGSGVFDDWDAKQYQERAKELAIIVGGIIESEGDELSKLSGKAYEERLMQINDRIKQAYKDLGLDITKTFAVSGGKIEDLGIDVNTVNIMTDYMNRIGGIVENRNRLADSIRQGEEATRAETNAVDVESLSFADLFKAAQTAKDKVGQVNNAQAKPTVSTSSIDQAIIRTDKLINNLSAINGNQIFAASGFTPKSVHMPQADPFGLWNQKINAGVVTGADASWGSANMQIQALHEIDRRMAAAIRTRKGTADMLKDINAALETVVSGTAEEKKLLQLQARLQNQQKKFNAASTVTTKNTKADAEREAKERVSLQERLNKSLEDLQRNNTRVNISLVKDEHKKRMLEIANNFNEERDRIKNQAKGMADLNKKLGKETNANGLTDEQQKTIDKAEILNAETRRNAEADLYRELLGQYQGYTDQRLAIEKKFNDDIAVLEEARRRAQERGDSAEADSMGRAIAQATAEKGKALMQHDYDVLKQSPEYIRAFEDLKNTSSETLNSLLRQLEDAKGTAATVLNPEDLREYTTTIQSIMDELDSRNPFQAMADRYRELAEAGRELAEAKRRLETVQGGGKVLKGVTTSMGSDGLIQTKETYLTDTEAMEDYAKAKDKVQRANANYIKSENAAMKGVDGLAEAVKGLGSAIGGQAGEIVGLMGDVTLFATSTIEGISKVSKTGAESLSTLEKASVVLNIMTTAIQLLQKIGELGHDKGFKEYEKYADKLNEINRLTDAVNQYRIAVLETQQAEAHWFGGDGMQSLKDYREMHDAVFKAYTDKAMEAQAIYRNKSGGGWLTDSINWVMGNMSILSGWKDWKDIWGQGSFAQGQTAAINNLRIETRKADKGFMGTGIGGKSQKTEDLRTWARNQGLGELFDNEGMINRELAQSILDNYGDKLVGQTKETLEALVKLKEDYDKYMDELHEYVSGLYEPLVDNFVDSIWDWLDNGKDALDSFKDYASDTFRNIATDMLRQIVLSKIFGEGEDSYQNKIKALYDDYAKGLIDEAELNRKVTEITASLMKNAETQLPVIQGMAENIQQTIKNGTGIDIKKNEEQTQQDSTKKGFATASQDSIDELNGRFTGVQMATNGILDKVSLIGVDCTITRVNIMAIRAQSEEIRNLSLTALGHLEAISKNTHELYQMNERLGQIEKNTRNL